MGEYRLHHNCHYFQVKSGFGVVVLISASTYRYDISFISKSCTRIIKKSFQTFFRMGTFIDSTQMKL